MKASEIKTDGTEYAYQSRPGNRQYRVRVIQKVAIPNKRPGRCPQSGWLVEAIDGRGEGDFGGPGKGSRFRITDRQLTRLWASSR